MGRNRLAFTLAEILIVLGVIGIVAEMTIPTLVANTTEQANRAAFKSIFADLTQATNSIANANGGLTSAFSTVGDCGDFRNLFLPYFKYVKTCEENSFTCWHNVNTTPIKTNSGTNMGMGGSTTWSSAFAGMQLSNGAFIRFRPANLGECNSTDPLCAMIFVDVNGFKKPNVFGRDIYYAEIVYPNGLIPCISWSTTPIRMNQSDVDTYCSKSCNDPDYCGATCSAKVIYNQDY